MLGVSADVLSDFLRLARGGRKNKKIMFPFAEETMASFSFTPTPILVLDYSKLTPWDSLRGADYPTDLRPALDICEYKAKDWGEALLTSMNTPLPVAPFKDLADYTEVTTDLVGMVGPAALPELDYLRNGWQPCWEDVAEKDKCFFKHRGSYSSGLVARLSSS